MDLVRTLAAVVDAGSLEAAATRLQVTPSAVSQRLKSLENQLGRVLLARSKPVRPTVAGQAIVRLARQLDALEHDTLAELGLTQTRRLEVPLAVNADSLATWLLPALAPLAITGIHFDLHRDDQNHTAALLESGLVSAAVTSQEHPVAGCSVRPLGSMRYLPVATPKFVDTWLTESEDSGFRSAPLIDFDHLDSLQTQFLEAIEVDPSVPPRHYVPASSDFARACELGFGWALVPEYQALPAIVENRLARLGGPHLDVPLFWQRWKLKSPVLESIEEAVIDRARQSLRS